MPLCLIVFFIIAIYAIAARKGNAPIPSLGDLPTVIAGYGSTTLTEDPGVKEFSSVTDSLTRFYQREGSRPILVYIGYYRTSSELKGLFHTPSVCLTASGWEVKHLIDHELSGSDGSHRVRMRLVLSEKSGQKQAMLYWYTIGPYTTGHERTAHFYTGYDAIFGHYSDVVKVMISTEYGSDAELDSCVKATGRVCRRRSLSLSIVRSSTMASLVRDRSRPTNGALISGQPTFIGWKIERR